MTTDRHADVPVSDVRAVSFDLFGTLVEATRPTDPAAAVAAALTERGVAVPDDWPRRYASAHVETEPGAEVSLYDHVAIALRAETAADDGQSAARTVVKAAVDEAFEPTVETRPDARAVVQTVAERWPVALFSNVAVPGLAERAIGRSALAADDFDAIRTSVGTGWRKPDPRSFETVADALDVAVDDLLHVGDDPATDGGITAAGGWFLAVDDGDLERVLDSLEVKP